MTTTTLSPAQRHLNDLQMTLQAAGPSVARAWEWGEQLASVLLRGGRLLAAGNGGSAAQAQHLTAELVGRYREERSPFSALCLSSETSTLTALVNDYPREELYARQVQAHGRPGDVLVLLSTSGRSPNVVAAAHRGCSSALSVWAFTGPAPNPLADAVNQVIAVEAATAATVQEMHLVLLHVLCEGLDAALAARARTLSSTDIFSTGTEVSA